MPRGVFVYTFNMELIDGFKKFWTRAFDYHGTSSRREFWWGVLGNAIIMLILLALLVISLTCISPQMNTFSSIMIIVFALFCLVELIPSVTLIIRRMHDIGRSGFFIFVLFIPVIGYIWYIYLVTRRGVENKYNA
ncbi:MAG: DUF805 domain-containing protein [Clostridia bacterium]|nr:DUF805 domain-containing protein [Clostridia bacterium]